MRTVRALAVGTAILVALVAPAGAAIAEDPEPAGAVVVTGTESCELVQNGTTNFAGPAREFRDHLMDCVNETTDPRVNGTFRNTFNEDCHEMDRPGLSACVLWGTHVMDGDEGGWDCSYAGTDDLWSMNVGQVLVVCPGTGANTGLTYVYHHVFGGLQDWGDGTDIHGLIYEGPPPAWGPMAEPTA